MTELFRFDMQDFQIIKKITEDHFGLDLKQKSHKRHIVDARRIYFKTLKTQTRMSLIAIGETLGLHHATVINSLNTFDQIFITDEKFANDYITLKGKIKNFISEKDKSKPLRKHTKSYYSSFLGKEDQFQISIMKYIKMKYPKSLAVHIPNEGKRSPFEQYKFKILGGLAGMPDIMIFDKNSKYSGLAIELKVGYNKPTVNQKNCLEALKMRNWRTLWTNDQDDCIKIIDEYFEDAC